ncbi:MAG: SDR family oxidoreductase [Thioalkalivibrio sp.]|nr:SDR family oxidoreductase [Thioalkalivibrio sp.]
MDARGDFFNVAGKTVVVTGASKGIGRGIALEFAGRGAEIVAIARDPDALASLCREIEEASGRCIYIHADIATDEGCERAINEVLAARSEVHILVNSAGVSFPERATDTTLEHWDRTFAVNARALFVLTQAFGRGMVERGWGRIIHVSSQAGLVAIENHAAYGASKGAVEMLSKVLALEWAPHGVTVNCIAPTVIDTAMAKTVFPTEEARRKMLDRIPVGRFGKVDEVSAAALFLASERAAMITGDTLRVDGGWTAQ